MYVCMPMNVVWSVHEWLPQYRQKLPRKKKAAASVSPPFCVGATPLPRVNVHYRGKVYELGREAHSRTYQIGAAAEGECLSFPILFPSSSVYMQDSQVCKKMLKAVPGAARALLGPGIGGGPKGTFGIRLPKTN